MATKKQFIDMLAPFSDDAEIIIDMVPTYNVRAKEPEPVVATAEPVEEAKAE